MADSERLQNVTKKTSLVNGDDIFIRDSEVATALQLKRAGVDTVSEKVQADLFDNDAVMTVADADLIPVEVSGVQKVVTRANLFKSSKNYYEYRFRITQAGTNNPTIIVDNDEHGLEEPITFTRTAIGQYRASIAGLIRNSDISYTNVEIPNNIMGIIGDQFHIIGGKCVLDGGNYYLYISTALWTGTADGLLNKHEIIIKSYE
jgi:hypothetical protein